MVAGSGAATLTPGASSTPKSRASSTVSSTRTGASGWLGPKSYRVSRSSHAMWRVHVTAASFPPSALPHILAQTRASSPAAGIAGGPAHLPACMRGHSTVSRGISRHGARAAERHDGTEEDGMDDAGTARAAGEEAIAALAPEAGLFARLDPVNLTSSLLAVGWRAALSPVATSNAFWQFGSALARIGPDAAGQWSAGEGREREPAGKTLAKDKRFADPAWRENPVFFAIGQAYLAAVQLADGLLAAGRGDPVTDAKARLASDLLLAALAPTNYLATNPAALKRAFDTGGASLVAGTRNFLSDLRDNKGMPRQVDTRPFEIGRNLAATPGKVIFRNDLMELIQYAPQTPQVRSVPMLASPPWINKYYIMDLAPGRSFLEWAVQHERTVFAISYRNPDRSMSGVTLDDYLVDGPRTALEVISEITGSPKIDIIGLCLGGALTAMLAAYLAGTGDQRLGSVTLLNTLLDYSDPGVLGAFTDELTVSRLERQMQEHGVLEGSQMAATFDALRPNDLIFNYVVSNWLLGQDPPAFDILAWNSDSTRMPAAMHAFYLRALYLRN